MSTITARERTVASLERSASQAAPGMASRLPAPEPRVVRFDAATLSAACLMLTAAYLLKLGFSRAGATDLVWILAPSGWLAKHIGGVPLVWEPYAGWISHSARMVVGTACAGVNFLVVSWLALYFSRQSRWGCLSSKLACALSSFAVAYLATVFTNAARIALSAHLFSADIYTGWVTPARVHRALGVVMYCATLLGLDRLFGAASRRAASGGTASRTATFGEFVPFVWYLAVALGVPVLNRAFARNPEQFAEHACWTLALGLAVFVCFKAVDRVRDRVSS